jgi:transposase
MRKIKEVLRLRHELGLYQEQIARSCSIGQSTVHRYLERAEAAQLVWPLAEDWDDAKIEQLLFPVKVGFKAAASAPIDFAGIHQELVSHKYLTLQLLWEEYKQSNPEGYQYSWFCQRYRDWLKTRDLVLRQDHRAGEKLFVDHAGGTIPVIDRGTGEVEPAYVFVAVMGASSYTYVEASMHRDLPSWIGAHMRAFEFFQGCPLAVVPDNWKTAVNRACRYMPDVNVTYQEMAAHYGVAVVPARPRKPRDKAKVEAGVQVAGRWLVAALRKRQFFSVGGERSARGVVAAVEREAIPETQRLPPGVVRHTRPACLTAASSHPVLHRRMENHPGQPGLSRRRERALLQRALPTGRPTSGSPFHIRRGGTVLSRAACGQPHPRVAR